MSRELYKVTIEKIVSDKDFIERNAIPKTTILNFTTTNKEMQKMIDLIESMYEQLTITQENGKGNNVETKDEKQEGKGTEGSGKRIQ